MKILLLENIHPVAKEAFEKSGFTVDIHPKSYSDKELIDLTQDYQVIGIRSKTQLTGEVLEKCSHLQAIGCFCIGTNQVNLEKATQAGIPVFNAPYSNTRSVAELVISEVIALSRGLFDMSRKVHTGQWDKSAKGSFEVRGKTLGIVGYGHIGSQVSILAEALGMKVLYYDIVNKLPLGNSQAVESLDMVLKFSDFVTLHVPATDRTHNMITKKQMNAMKPGAALLNLSRGTVVNIADLAEAVESGQIGGAAIDVYPEEPKSNSDGFQSPLQGLKNVILTPHIGGSTEEAQFNIGNEVSNALTNFIARGETTGAVQFPNIQAPSRPDAKRLLNVHKNVPGVLGDINSIVSELGVNIMSQHLGTNNQIGYLLMDMEPGKAKQVSDRISQLETSIKTRVL